MSNTVYWTMKNGQKINVDEMSESHLRNAFKMLIKNHQNLINKTNEIIEDYNKLIKSKKSSVGVSLQGDMAQQFHENFPATEDDVDDILDDMQGEIIWDNGEFYK